MESYGNGTNMTIDDFLISMNIHITPLDDSHGRSMSSFLEEIFSNTSSTGKSVNQTYFVRIFDKTSTDYLQKSPSYNEASCLLRRN